MKNIFKNLLISSLSFATFQLFAQKKSADIIVHNAVVYTVDNQFAKTEAFAIKDGKFLETGTSKSILTNYTAKQKIDADKAKAIIEDNLGPNMLTKFKALSHQPIPPGFTQRHKVIQL
jgi:uncharacterized protein (UPF0332 family)